MGTVKEEALKVLNALISAADTPANMKGGPLVNDRRSPPLWRVNARYSFESEADFKRTLGYLKSVYDVVCPEALRKAKEEVDIQYRNLGSEELGPPSHWYGVSWSSRPASADSEPYDPTLSVGEPAALIP